ncbi:MAG: hypothetical protein JWN46_279 [Acidimicrobiales bacterium]|nr:hypothetical protein [Acidimicrobiales bacterium]
MYLGGVRQSRGDRCGTGGGRPQGAQQAHDVSSVLTDRGSASSAPIEPGPRCRGARRSGRPSLRCSVDQPQLRYRRRAQPGQRGSGLRGSRSLALGDHQPEARASPQRGSHEPPCTRAHATNWPRDGGARQVVSAARRPGRSLLDVPAPNPWGPPEAVVATNRGTRPILGAGLGRRFAPGSGLSTPPRPRWPARTYDGDAWFWSSCSRPARPSLHGPRPPRRCSSQGGTRDRNCRMADRSRRGPPCPRG